MAQRPSEPDIHRDGEASGRHQSLRRDARDQPDEQRLKDVSLEDEESFEDDQRDRRGNGQPPTGH